MYLWTFFWYKLWYFIGIKFACIRVCLDRKNSYSVLIGASIKYVEYKNNTNKQTNMSYMTWWQRCCEGSGSLSHHSDWFRYFRTFFFQTANFWCCFSTFPIPQHRQWLMFSKDSSTFNVTFWSISGENHAHINLLSLFFAPLFLWLRPLLAPPLS